jgi:hypothetical protein
MIPALLTKLGLPVLVSVLGDTLTQIDHPLAKGASKALGELGDAFSRGEISSEALAEMNRHAEELARLKSDEYRIQIAEINQSLRTEVASHDPYVRRMRPTFGYLMAITWAAQMLALAWVILDDPENASLVLEGFESLGVIWTIGLSVLGIYVYKRSEEKRSDTGGAKEIIDALKVMSEKGILSHTTQDTEKEQDPKKTPTVSYNS